MDGVPELKNDDCGQRKEGPELKPLVFVRIFLNAEALRSLPESENNYFFRSTLRASLGMTSSLERVTL